MALSFAQAGDLPYYIVGNQKKTVTDVTLDNSYTSGGEVVNASDLGLNNIDHAEAQIKVNANATDSMVSVNFSETSGQSGKLVFYEETPGAITAADDLTGCTVRVIAYGY